MICELIDFIFSVSTNMMFNFMGTLNWATGYSEIQSNTTLDVSVKVLYMTLK